MLCTTNTVCLCCWLSILSANLPLVKCVKHDIDVSTIRDMQAMNHSYTSKSGLELMLPLNVLYKIRARVVDFWPPVLEDFASLASPADGSGEESDNDIDMIDLSSSETWRWDFYLLLEDIKSNRRDSSPAQQWVHVEHRDAEFLLSMDDNPTE
jgi:protection-of-telomeres protein 1